jgi:hypothetical protein
MQIVVMLRELWRHRRLVMLSGLIAVAIGVLMLYSVSPPIKLQTRAYTVGIASTTAMLDTPSSQVVDLGGGQNDDVAASAGSLPGRAALLANVLTKPPRKDQIAQAAGIDPLTLIAESPSPDSTLPRPAVGSISPNNPRASLLTVSTFEGLPILGVNVTAPDERTALKLSNGAITVLLAHIASLAKTDGVPANRRLVVKQLGPPRVATAKHGPSRKLAAVVVLFIFCLLCAAILIVSWLRTSWDQARWEDVDPEDPLVPPVDWERLAPERYEQDGRAAPAHVDSGEPAPSAHRMAG